MQCPSCDFEAPQADFGDPLRCPGCGAYYEKALRLKLSAGVQAQSAAVPAAVPAAVDKPKAAVSAHVRSVAYGLDGAQPVVVVDVQMRFWSMVLFIIKWALASIPALLILMFIFAGIISFAGVWFSALLK